jgi:hypothetical protein
MFRALLVGDRSFALTCGGMRAGCDDSRPGLEHRATQLADRSDRRTRAVMDVGDQLNLAGMQLAFDRARHPAQPLEHRGRTVRQISGEGSTRNSSSSIPIENGSLEPK